MTRTECPGAGLGCPAQWWSGIGENTQAWCVHDNPLAGQDLKTAVAEMEAQIERDYLKRKARGTK